MAAIASVGLAAGPEAGAGAPRRSRAPTGPDPREIPVPRIPAPLGTLPGVTELPTRTAMPEVW